MAASPKYEPFPEEEAGEEALDVSERLAGIVSDLERRAEARVGKRHTIEQRWLEDLRQYHGYGGEGTTKDESQARGAATRSRANINMTRPKTNAMAARINDLLFPTDDKNWGIRPTPVPELVEAAKAAADAAVQKREQEAQAAAQAEAAAAAGDQAGAQFATGMQQGAGDAAAEFEAQAKQFQATLEEAKKRAERMSLEIEDQLTECQYQAQARDAVEDACKIGIGVMKGPVVGDKHRQRWVRGPEGAYQMESGGDPRPRYFRVDPWSFFPDPDARTVEESEGFFERHLMNKKMLRRLARLPSFDKAAISKLLKGKPRGQVPGYLSDLRSITGDSQPISDERYIVWEFTGALECESIKILAEAMGDEELAKQYENEDPLLEINACVWFCDGQVLKFSIYPLDSGEPLYSVFCLEKDEATIFGYGIPYIMRHSSRAFSAAWRMMLDNAGLSVGPQIVIDREKIDPADGKWELAPRKIWFAKNGIPKDARAFEAFDVPMHQQELAGLIALAKSHIDEETAMPLIAQGEQGSSVTKTAQGMAILMNSANIVFRRVVKNFDDDMTVPNIRRAYDWNMQFNNKAEIKGDFEVDARGSSVLLVREMQAQNLMALVMHFGAHPKYGHMIKGAPSIRTLFNVHMLPAAEHVHDDETIALLEKQMAEQAAAAAAAAAGGEPPEITERKFALQEQELQAKVEMANLEAGSRERVATMQRDTAMMQLAARMNLSMDETRAMIENDREERAFKERLGQTAIDSKERIVAAEAAMAQRTGVNSGGSV